MEHYANQEFYRWEKAQYGDNSPLSDNDREVWVKGYLWAQEKMLNFAVGGSK